MKFFFHDLYYFLVRLLQLDSCDQSIKCQFCPDIETIQLIYCTNQLTGFYMRATLAFKGYLRYKTVFYHQVVLNV